MYKIVKVINNNIVCSINEDGKEIILRGLGIGFNKKPNENVEANKIEKIYTIADTNTRNKLEELLADIPVDYVKISTEIIEYAKKVLKQGLNDNIYLTLTDHISFAIQRMNNGLAYKNALLTEIKRFYATEYTIGVHALDIIKEKLEVELPIDEAGFIALHIVNAELDTNMSDMMSITEFIHKVLDIVRDYYGINLDEESSNYDRLVTHLKFFGQRLFNNAETRSEDIVFQEMIRMQYPKDYECASIIRQHVEDLRSEMVM